MHMYCTMSSPTCLPCCHVACLLCLLVSAASSRWQGTLLRGARWSVEDLQTLAKHLENHAHQVSQNESQWFTSDFCPHCEGKDYSDICPLGWRFTEMEGSCSAPQSYNGLCGRDIVLAGRPAVDKREIELTCSVCWPCRVQTGTGNLSCVRDWERECPNGYTPAGIPWDAYAVAPTRCVATALYEGMCEPEVNFAGLHEKQSFSERCATSWPCSDDCSNQSAMSTCPLDWLHIGKGLCVAPDHYRREGCQLVKSFRGWSSSMKSSFAGQCYVRWGCGHGETDALFQQNPPVCDDIEPALCPVGWYKNDALCVPPAASMGPCASAMDFSGWSDDEKFHWGSHCIDVEWPCRRQFSKDVASVLGPEWQAVENARN